MLPLRTLTKTHEQERTVPFVAARWPVSQKRILYGES